ncbi:MAG: sulfatase [Bryobacteraceae bacterium]
MSGSHRNLPSRRSFLSRAALLGSGLGSGLGSVLGSGAAPALLRGAAARRPNILFAISDDQSYPHTGATGDKVVKTPSFDRVAAEGVLFRQAYGLSPGCAPSRAGILTGRFPWQIEEAGTHASAFPRSLTVYPNLLAAAGYHVGLTGKGAGPANFQGSGWPHNPAGPPYDKRRAPTRGLQINANDYAANFEDFLGARPKDSPFCFWFGCHEPHRGYTKGSGLKSGKRLEDVTVPPFLPDNAEVRGDLLDYYLEIEHFDSHLGRMLAMLEKAGELDNTLVVATADNGMSFPGSKASMYDYGIHLPLTMMWKDRAKGGRVSDDLVSFADFAPTFLEAAGVRPAPAMVGRSLVSLLGSGRSGRIEPSRERVFSGRERHSHARRDNLGYPARAMREGKYLYIWNMKPDRWPAGDPKEYYDIDNGPTKTWMMANQAESRVLFEHGFGKRPEEELFDVAADPGCLRNLAGEAAHARTRASMRRTLERALEQQRDPRVTGNGDIWESYPRYSGMRPELGGFAEQGKYNPNYRH